MQKTVKREKQETRCIPLYARIRECVRCGEKLKTNKHIIICVTCESEMKNNDISYGLCRDKK